MPLVDPGLPTADTPRIKWGKLYGAAAALAIAEAAAKAAGPLIVITQNSRDAESLSDEIAFFSCTGLPLRIFQTWRPCRTTASPLTRISPRHGLRRWRSCRAREKASGSWR